MSEAPLELLILGASGFGREVLWVIEDIPEEERGWRVSGFLDDDVERAELALTRMSVGLPVRGNIRDHHPKPHERFVNGIGLTRGKLKVCDEMRNRGAEFVSLIHPTALLHPDATHGVGLFLGPLSTLSAGCVVGDFVALSPSAGASPDTNVGSGCFLGARCDLMDGASLGRGVLVGSHATIHPGVHVGDFATVGIGSVVLHNVPPSVSVLGVPARTLPL